jgi:TDG/mug DNA glycosylase family protein
MEDVIAPGLDLLIVGINPGLVSEASGYHFARPGNRFWQALHDSGMTDRLLDPSEQEHLLSLGIGITNIAARASGAASELSSHELTEGRRVLEAKIRRYQPRIVAFLGAGAYRAIYDSKAQVGRQSRMIEEAAVWVLPNPSGRTRGYSHADFARLFGQLRSAMLLSHRAQANLKP